MSVGQFQTGFINPLWRATLTAPVLNQRPTTAQLTVGSNPHPLYQWFTGAVFTIRMIAKAPGVVINHWTIYGVVDSPGLAPVAVTGFPVAGFYAEGIMRTDSNIGAGDGITRQAGVLSEDSAAGTARRYPLRVLPNWLLLEVDTNASPAGDFTFEISGSFVGALPGGIFQGPA
jgi:hypothetical protein